MHELGTITNIAGDGETPNYLLTTTTGFTASYDEIGYTFTYTGPTGIESAEGLVVDFTEDVLNTILSNDGKCVVDFEMVELPVTGSFSEEQPLMVKDLKRIGGKIVVTPYEN